MRQRNAWTPMMSGRKAAAVPIGLHVSVVAGVFAVLAATHASGLAAAQPAAPGLLISPLPTPSLPALPTPSLPALPTPSPPALPTPPSLPAPLPTPSPPVSLTPPPTPPLATSPTPSAASAGAGSSSGGSAPGAGGGSGGSGSGPGHGITIPFTPIVLTSPLDVAFIGALVSLPLLFGMWLLLFGRTWNEARRSREAQTRLAIANDLGLRPRELISVSTKGLFKLREKAAFDELTGVLRRAAGMAALDREVSRARRQKAALSVAFVDVDGLKETNDKRGHKAGDDMLRSLAATLKAGLRGQDLVIRYGGDEFVCILPDTVADAARAKLSWIQTEAEKSGLGFSAGVAQLERSDDLVSLLARADTEMYAVKSRGGVVRDIRLGVVGGKRATTT